LNDKRLIITIASGKGGTGKTTVATNLAATLARMGQNVLYLDADVEEPNGHIFIKPEIERETVITRPVPEVDLEKCNFCGKCSGFCQFHAIAVIKDKVLVFPELCHSCGGCYHICPEKAIVEKPAQIGVVRTGAGEGVSFVEGRLGIGEIVVPPLIRAAKESISDSKTIIVDAPPGTSCPVIEALDGSDYVLLVTEPTPFGLHDLKLVMALVKELGMPFGVIINRAGNGYREVNRFCRDEGAEVLLEIPDDRVIASTCSEGRLVVEDDIDYRRNLEMLYTKITERVSLERAGNLKR